MLLFNEVRETRLVVLVLCARSSYLTHCIIFIIHILYRRPQRKLAQLSLLCVNLHKETRVVLVFAGGVDIDHERVCFAHSLKKKKIQRFIERIRTSIFTNLFIATTN